MDSCASSSVACPRPRRARIGTTTAWRCLQQLDRAPRLLSRRHGLWGDHLHIHVEMNRNHLDKFSRGSSRVWCLVRTVGPRRPAGRGRSAAPCARRMGRARAGTFYAEVARGEPSDAYLTTTRRATIGDLLHLGNEHRPRVVLSFREHLSNMRPTGRVRVTGDDRIYDSARTIGLRAAVERVGAARARGDVVMARRFSATVSRPHRRHGATIAAAIRPLSTCARRRGAAHHDNLPALRFVTSSSARCWSRNAPLRERFGVPVAQGYGERNGWVAAVRARPAARHRRRPLPYHDVAIVDADGRGCRGRDRRG